MLPEARPLQRLLCPLRRAMGCRAPKVHLRRARSSAGRHDHRKAVRTFCNHEVCSRHFPSSSTEPETVGCGPFKRRGGAINPAPTLRTERRQCCTARARPARGSGFADPSRLVLEATFVSFQFPDRPPCHIRGDRGVEGLAAGSSWEWQRRASNWCSALGEAS